MSQPPQPPLDLGRSFANTVVLIVGGVAALAVVGIILIYLFAPDDRATDEAIQVIGFATVIATSLLALVSANNAAKQSEGTHTLVNSRVDQLIELRAREIVADAAVEKSRAAGGGGGHGAHVTPAAPGADSNSDKKRDESEVLN